MSKAFPPMFSVQNGDFGLGDYSIGKLGIRQYEVLCSLTTGRITVSTALAIYAQNLYYAMLQMYMWRISGD